VFILKNRLIKEGIPINNPKSKIGRHDKFRASKNASFDVEKINNLKRSSFDLLWEGGGLVFVSRIYLLIIGVVGISLSSSLRYTISGLE